MERCIETKRGDGDYSVAWTYIVECADKSYYVGSTTDLDRRIWEHNEGLGAKYTRRRRPVRLVYAEEFARVADAYEWEKHIQGWGRAKREALIRGDYDGLPELARKHFGKRTTVCGEDERSSCATGREDEERQ